MTARLIGAVRFSHVGLNCRDPLRMEAFYSRRFGFVRARVYDLVPERGERLGVGPGTGPGTRPGAREVIVLRLGDFRLELFAAEGERPIPAPRTDGWHFAGVRHLCFQVDDLDEALTALGDDVTLTEGPLEMSRYVPGMRVAFVADPEGNIIELNQGYADEPDPPVFEPPPR